MKKLYFSFVIILLTLTSISQTYNYYYGNIHSQSIYSDGAKDAATTLISTPLQIYNYAKQSLHSDFLGISDHNHFGAGMHLADYAKGLSQADSANIDGSFVAMYGMEWGEIASGGHAIVYGFDKLIGWEAGNYDIFNAQTNYAGLFAKVNAKAGAFAYLAHPNATDYDTLFSKSFRASADSAIVGMAVRSGPAFSTNTTYSNPSTASFETRYKEALSLGYHLGVGIDHDNHYTTYNRSTAGRLVVLATSLTRANILDGIKKMRCYASDDFNAQVLFTVNNQPMGSIISQSGVPSISVTINDPDNEAVSSILIVSGVPGSSVIATTLISNTASTTLTYSHNILNSATYYYYAVITQADGNKIWTSPIWYTRNDNPPVANFAAKLTTVCAAQSISFTDQSTNTPTSWLWTFPGGMPSSSTLQNPIITYNTAGSYNVTLTATNSSGNNTMTKTAYVTINALPVLTVSPASASICSGSSVNLTASGATSYAWSPSTGLNVASGPTVMASPSSSQSYTVTGTNNGCSAATSAAVTVNAIPVISITPANSSICSGGSVNLTANGATSYIWSPSSGLNVTNGATVTASPSSSQLYTVTGTNNGCSAATSATVTVNATPVISVTPSNSSICSGGSVNLTASGASSYIWSPSTGLNVTNGATVMASPSSSQFYTVTGTGNGCSASTSATVIVNATPLISLIPANATINSGGSVNLTASGATTYTWSPSIGLNTSTGATVTANPTNSTTYTVTGSTGSCSGSNTASVIVSSTASLAISISPASASICQGTSVTLTASGATFYAWSPSTGLNITSGATVIANPSATTTYTVTGTTGSSTGTQTIVITVKPTPATPIVTQNGFNLTSSAASGNQWYFNGGIIAGATLQTYSIPKKQPLGSYTVKVTNTYGCSATSSALITRLANPNVNILVSSSSNTICQGASTILTADGADSYTWSPSTGLNKTDGTSVTARPEATTTYTVTGIIKGNLETNTIIVTVNPTLTKPLITRKSAKLISNAESGNQWYCNGNIIEGAISQTYSIPLNQPQSYYTVTVKNKSGCEVSSVPFKTKFGIKDKIGHYSIKILPNPSNGQFTLTFSILFPEEYSIHILNELGQAVYDETIRDFTGIYSKEIDISKWGKGIYFMNLMNNGEKITKKIVVE